MLTELRAAVYDYLTAPSAGWPTAPVWDEIPDDPAELPCIVVGRPGALPTATSVVFDMELDVYVIGRRQQAGGSEVELSSLADQVWLRFNGTRATNHQGHGLRVGAVVPREQTIAGLGYPSYVITVISSVASC